MNNPLFLKLIKFCNLSRKNNPLEDFTTEILAGVLRSSQLILNMFCKDVLKLEGGNYSIETQKSYPGSYVDMVFYNNDTLCFLENKVNSLEGYNQLKKYTKILSEEKSKYRVVQLRYCTKIKDDKNKKDYTMSGKTIFKQFRWKDIYCFLENYREENPLVESFLEYLSEYDMKNINEFNIQDIAAINSMSQVLRKIESNINEITPYYTKIFNKPKKSSSENFKQLKNHSRYPIYSGYVIKSNPQKWSHILLGFTTGDTEYPSISVEISCVKEHSEYALLLTELVAFEELEAEFYVKESDWGVAGKFEAPLSNFLASENQHKELQKWFVQAIDKLNSFVSNTSNIPWSIK